MIVLDGLIKACTCTLLVRRLFQGNITLRFSYGRDPASEEDYKMSHGMHMVGLGIAACPHPDQTIERLVTLPVGTDRMNVCSELQEPSWVGRATSFLNRLGAQLGLARTRTNLVIDSLESSEYLANHLPNMAFDAAMRQLSTEVDAAKQLSACQLAALRLPQCVVSSKCDTAIRPHPSPHCNSCGSDLTCQEYYGQAGAVCDSRSSVMSGWLCYYHKPPTVLGLLTLPNRLL